jgi:hypothetical protein
MVAGIAGRTDSSVHAHPVPLVGLEACVPQGRGLLGSFPTSTIGVARPELGEHSRFRWSPAFATVACPAALLPGSVWWSRLSQGRQRTRPPGRNALAHRLAHSPCGHCQKWLGLPPVAVCRSRLAGKYRTSRCDRERQRLAHGWDQHCISERNLRRVQGFSENGATASATDAAPRRDGKDEFLQTPRDKIVATALGVILGPLWRLWRPHGGCVTAHNVWPTSRDDLVIRAGHIMRCGQNGRPRRGWRQREHE